MSDKRRRKFYVEHRSGKKGGGHSAWQTVGDAHTSAGNASKAAIAYRDRPAHGNIKNRYFHDVRVIETIVHLSLPRDPMP